MEHPDHDDTKYFPSGEWEGFYLYPHRAEKFRMDCFLTFSDGVVTGGGNDNVGAFSWRGTYDPVARKCEMIKQYQGAHQVFYFGSADENGIGGTWLISPTWSAGFQLWPKQYSQEAYEEETALESMPMEIEVGAIKLV